MYLLGIFSFYTTTNAENIPIFKTKPIFFKNSFFLSAVIDWNSLQNNIPIVGSFVFKNNILKVGLSPSKEKFFICFNDGPSKVMKNAFYFILKALFVLKIFKFLS